MDEVNKVNKIPDLVPSLVLQPITTAVTSHFSKDGGNALGFDDRDGPLIRQLTSILPTRELFNICSDSTFNILDRRPKR